MSVLSSLAVIITADTRELQKELNSTKRTLQSFGQDAARAGAALTASITAPLLGAGLAAVKVAGDFEQTQVAFTKMLGSAQEATNYLKELQAFALKTPFTFPELTVATQKLLAFGFGAKEVVPMLRTIGDAVAGLKGGPELFDRIAIALGQMKARGVVSAEEMRQLAQAGIPVWENLAKAIGVGIPEAMKLVENRAVQSAQAIPVILAGMTERFGGMMDEQSKTLLGKWSNLKDKLYATAIEVGEPLLDTAKNLLDATLPLLDTLAKLAKSFSELSPGVQQFILGATAIAAAVGPILMGLGGMAMGLSSMVGLLSKAAPLLLGAAGSVAGWATSLATSFVPAVVGGTAALTALAAAAVVVVTAIGAIALYKIVDGCLRLRDAQVELTAAQAQGEVMVKKMADRLKEHGVVIERGTMSLDEWRKKLTVALQEIGKKKKVTEDATKADGAHATGLEGLADKLKKATDETKRFSMETLDHTVALGKAKTEAEQAKRNYDVFLGSFDDYIFEAESLRIAWQDEGYVLNDLSKVKVPEFISALTGLRTATGLQEQAYRKIADAEQNLKEKAALKSVLDAEIAAAKTAGSVVPAEHLKMLEKMRADLDEKTPEMKGKWADFGREVSTIITNTTQSMARAFFDGDLSWGEKTKAMLKDLGVASVSLFITPFTDAVANFISGALTDLIGGKGLGGVMDRLKGIGSAIGGIFGGGGAGGGFDPTQSVDGIGGMVGGAGGGIGGIGGVAGGAASWGQSLATGGIAALGGILGGVITGAMMGGDLGKIEENTRFTKDGIGASGGVIDQTARLANMFSDFSAYMSTGQRDILMGIADYTYGTAERMLTLIDKIPTGPSVSFSNCTFGTSKSDTEAALSAAMKQAFASA